MSGDCSNDRTCLNKDESLHLKIAGIASILVASAIGVAIPLIFKNFSRTKVFFAGQCFAAGVILATGFVHILPDAFDALTNPCLAEHPWGKFPFAGFIAMLTAILTLLLDSVAVGYYFHKASKSETVEKPDVEENVHGPHAHAHHIMNARGDQRVHSDHLEFNEGQQQQAPHAHAHHIMNVRGDQRVHSDHLEFNADQQQQAQQGHSHNHNHNHNHNHAKVISITGVKDQIRKKVIAQVLEFGIIAHSVIIGISMGASDSPCTVRPLVGALVFHQLFEGLALGGCISLGDFKHLSKMLMSLFFAITTPGGIAIGIAISSSYNENNPKSLIVQGLFDSMSAGILVYMALVDLLASHFLSEEFLSKSCWHYALAYGCLLFGAGAMSVLAIWA